MIPCESLSETKEEWTVLTNLDKRGRDKGKGDVTTSCHYQSLYYSPFFV